ncbi:MAG: 4-hydroxybenzoate octaprenyltransferase [Casimicrobium sp.]
MTLKDLTTKLNAYERLIRLDKPVGFMLLMWPTLWGLWFASLGSPDIRIVMIFVVGTILMRSAGCAINDWADRKFDGAVKRTAMRPVASGEISGREALWVGAVCALVAACLLIPLHRNAQLWSLPALAIAAIYPFTKRWFSIPQAILGLAFSMGIPMAFAAVRNDDWELAAILVAANFFWVLAFDTEYAMVDRDDDVRIGIKTSALFFGRFDVAAVAVCYAAFLGIMTWVGTLNASGHLYYAGVVVATGLAAYHVWLIRNRERDACFKAFRANNLLGLALFAGVALDLAVRTGEWPRWY